MTAFFIFDIISKIEWCFLVFEDEFKEYLGGNISVICSKAHGFGSDAVLLADFAQCKKNDIACDLGTGCGIIPLIWCANGCAKAITAIDIQKRATQQLSRSVSLNNIEDKVCVINSDLKELKGVVRFGHFDLVTMNPPYKPVDSGILSNETADQIARHEVMCNINDICKSASNLLRFGGRLCLCNRPERLCDVITAMREADIEPKRLRFVSKNSSCAPWLFLIEGKKGSKPYLNILPQLFMQDKNGKDSEELIKIIGKYREAEK